MKVKEKRVCYHCSKEINKDDKQVLVRTYFAFEKGHSDDWFHWKCWLDNFSKAVKKKVVGLAVKAKEIMKDFGIGVDDWVKKETELKM